MVTRPTHDDELQTLICAIDGQLSEEEASELRARIGHDPGLKAQYDAALATRDSVGAALRVAPAEDQVAAIMARVAAAEDSQERPSWSGRAGLAAAMAAVIALAVGAPWLLSTLDAPPGGVATVAPLSQEAQPAWAPRGGGRSGGGGPTSGAVKGRLQTTVFLHRGGHERGLRDDDSVGSSDGLSVAFFNPRRRPRHALVFAVDRDRQVHWLAPVWVDARRVPTAIPIPAGPAQVSFAEGVTWPDLPVGPLALTALSCGRAVRVDQVERWLAEGGVDRVRRRCSGHLSRTWQLTVRPPSPSSPVSSPAPAPATEPHPVLSPRSTP